MPNSSGNDGSVARGSMAGGNIFSTLMSRVLSNNNNNNNNNSSNNGSVGSDRCSGVNRDGVMVHDGRDSRGRRVAPL